jgi:endonuclease-3
MTTAAQRNDRINKLYKVVKKHFTPVQPPTNRTVIEHMLYGCCLEDAPYELADEAFARLQAEYFDWNEVRVTTTAELAELTKRLPQPEEAANRVRRTLHGLFEAHYTFDLEFLKKENLGKAIEQISKYRGMTPFCVSYAAQVALGGHSIPIDQSLIELMKVLDVVTEADAANMKVTGLERTIPKNKGVEFASLVHQLAVTFAASPFNKDVRDIILEVDASAKDRFPRRGGRKAAEPEPAPVAAEKTAKAAKAPKVDKTDKTPKAQKAEKAKPAVTEKKKPVKAVTKAPKAAVTKAAKKPAAKKPALKPAAGKNVRKKR